MGWRCLHFLPVWLQQKTDVCHPMLTAVCAAVSHRAQGGLCHYCCWWNKPFYIQYSRILNLNTWHFFWKHLSVLFYFSAKTQQLSDAGRSQLTSNALLLQESFTHAVKHKHTRKLTCVYLSEPTKHSLSTWPYVCRLQELSIGSQFKSLLEYQAHVNERQPSSLPSYSAEFILEQ